MSSEPNAQRAGLDADADAEMGESVAPSGPGARARNSLRVSGALVRFRSRSLQQRLAAVQLTA
jgi:hypothetical protein